MKANEHGLIKLEDGRKIYEEQKCIETLSNLKSRLIEIDGELIYTLQEVDRLKDNRMEIKEAIERWEHELELTKQEMFKTNLTLQAEIIKAEREANKAKKKADN